jgi:hypothetical protein
MPFFAGSRTGAAAARNVIRRLSPATLVNLASHTGWLFPTAKMPAMVLLARCRPQPEDRLTVVNVPWSPAAERSYTFEIAPSDIVSLSLSSWESAPERLKTAAVGRGRDMLLVDELRSQYRPLVRWLESIGTQWRDGLILGKEQQRTRDAKHLYGLEVLTSGDLEPFRLPARLKRFRQPKAQWPRPRDTYRAPILLIKEFVKSEPRPIAAVAERDLVYTDAYFGASLPRKYRQCGCLSAGILSSALASWFFLMTASEFGIWKRRLLTNDVGMLPIPDLTSAVSTDAGRRILTLEEAFRDRGASPDRWNELDEAVFDLYGLDDIDRIVVSDGLARAKWQWQAGRESAATPADLDDLQPYTKTFLIGIEAWLQDTTERRMRAEIFNLSKNSPLRVIRFILDDGLRSPEVTVVEPAGDLAMVLGQIGRRLGVKIASSLVGERELRVHSTDEVIVIKPAARRFWMRGIALGDADAVIAESFAGAAL